MPPQGHGCFIGLIALEPGKAEAFETWHATDHLPENFALPQVVYANRWSGGDELLSCREGDPALGGVLSFMTYFFCEPVDAAIDEFTALAGRLDTGERGFSRQPARVAYARYHDLLAAEVSSACATSPQALPFVRHTGVWLVIYSDPGDATLALLGRPGILGGYRFVQRDPEPSDALAVGPGSAELYFVDGDLSKVWKPGAAGPSPVLSGVFDRSL